MNRGKRPARAGFPPHQNAPDTMSMQGPASRTARACSGFALPSASGGPVPEPIQTIARQFPMVLLQAVSCGGAGGDIGRAPCRCFSLPAFLFASFTKRNAERRINPESVQHIPLGAETSVCGLKIAAPAKSMNAAVPDGYGFKSVPQPDAPRKTQNRRYACHTAGFGLREITSPRWRRWGSSLRRCRRKRTDPD